MSARNGQKTSSAEVEQGSREAVQRSQATLQVLSLSHVAATLGVGRHLLAEWVRLGLVPMPYTLGRRRNGRTVAYAFLERDLPELACVVEQLKKGVVPR